MERSPDLFLHSEGVLHTAWIGVDSVSGQIGPIRTPSVQIAVTELASWIADSPRNRRGCLFTLSSEPEEQVLNSAFQTALGWILPGQLAIDSVTRELTREVIEPQVQYTEIGLLPIREGFSKRIYVLHHRPELRHSSGHENRTKLSPAFVGRESELREIRNALLTSRFVTIVGGPGMGVSRLLSRAELELWDDFKDGVIRLDPNTLPGQKPIELAIAQQLDLPWNLETDDARKIAVKLRQRSLLFVVDDLDDRRSELLSFFSGFLDIAIQCAVIASGPVWTAPSEYVVRLRGLKIASPGSSLDEIRQSDAIALLIENSEGLISDKSLKEKDARTLQRIAIQLDGNPLALLCAAKLLKLFGPTSLLNRLEDRFDILRTEFTGAMLSRFDNRFSRLSEGAQKLLAQISMFEGAISLRSIKEVLDDDWSDERTLLVALQELLDFGWCLPIDVELDERLFVLPANHRLFGLLRTTKVEQERLAIAHFHWLQNNIAKLVARVGDRTDEDEFEYLEAIYGEIRSLLRQLFRSGSTLAEAGDVIIQLYRFWFFRSYLDEGREWTTRFLDDKRSRDLASLPRIHLLASYLALFSGDRKTAINHAVIALRTARSSADKLVLCKSVGALSQSVLQSKPHLAWRLALRAVKLARELDDVPHLYTQIGNALAILPIAEPMEVADKLFTSAVQLETSHQDPFAATNLRNNMAEVCLERSHFGRARHFALVAIERANALQLNSYLPMYLRTLAACFIETNPAFAAQMLGASTQLAIHAQQEGSTKEQQARDALRNRIGSHLRPEVIRSEELIGSISDPSSLVETARSLDLPS